MNIKKILSSMTVEQKIAQLMQISFISVSKEEAKLWASKGVGSFLHALGDDAIELQQIALNSACHIPLLFGIDAIHGHALNKNATVFPTQLSMACSWDPLLVKEVGKATAKEVSADGLHWTFSPVLCLARDMRWGRVGETFGEDKYLTGELGCALIEGYQGDLSGDGNILACAKHYIGYGEAIGGRDSCDTEVTYRKLYDTFLPPFKRAVDGHCQTFMTAYGSIDGTPCTANKKLLTKILKNQLKFDGFVVTDWQNIKHLIEEQHVADDMSDACKIAFDAGNDMMMNCNEFLDAMVLLVKSGDINEKSLDKVVMRILRVKNRLGILDNPFKTYDKNILCCDKHIKLNKDISDNSIVLLKNNGILPLDKSKRILIVGEHADDIRLQYGDWTYFTHPLPNYNTKPQRPYTTLKEGIEGQFDNVSYIQGFDIENDKLIDMEKIQEQINNCDVVVFAFGDCVFLSSEGRDRANPTLTKSQRIVFEEISSSHKPIISILISTKPLCVPEVVDKSDAFLTAFNSGMFGGESMAKALVGLINPCGKLPISFPYTIGQIPVYYNQLTGWHAASYVDTPSTPLFTFGEGLSYTKFQYSNLKYDSDNNVVKVDVKNIGNYVGKEITQVYIRDEVSSVMTPTKQLIAFSKNCISVDEQITIEFKLCENDFSIVNDKCKRVVEAGEFEIMVGSSSRDEDLLKIKINK